MITTSNDTENSIHNTTERSVWIIYLLIVLLSSLIGDSIILIASVKYNAIKLNQFLVAVMQHIAICDILAAITYVLPTMISLIANKWVLGDTAAYIHVYLDSSSFTASSILICTLTTSKLLLLTFPLKTGYWTRKNAHVTCAVIWLLALLSPAVRLALDTSGLVFSFIEYNINFGALSAYSSVDKIVLNVFNVFTYDIPAVIVIVTTILTVVMLFKARNVARRIGGDWRWQGVVTVVATATVYCISVIPDRVTFMVFVSSTKEIPCESQLVRFAETLTTFNIMCNFFIYSLTILSFREFIRTKILRCTPQKMTQQLGKPEDSQPCIMQTSQII